VGGYTINNAPDFIPFGPLDIASTKPYPNLSIIGSRIKDLRAEVVLSGMQQSHLLEPRQTDSHDRQA